MRPKLAWIAFALLLAAGVYGFFQEDLYRLNAWFPDGWRRFRAFTSVYWVWSIALLIYRPALLMPLTIAALAFYSMWWVGPVAVLGPLFFLGSCWLAGKRLAPRATGVIAVLLGLAAWIFVISLAVHFPINTLPVYITALALPYLFGWREVWALARRIPESFAERTRQSLAPTLAAAVLLFVLLTHFLIALKPDVGADSLAMHLAAPMTVEYERKWDFDHERFVWALMPMGADWAYTAALLLSGESGVRLLNFAMLVLITLLIRGTARRWTSESHATLAAALFASTPLVQTVTGNVLVENLWAAVALGGLIVLIDGELIWAGALIGTALGVKFGTGAFLLPVLAVGAATAVREKKGRQALVGALLLIALAAPTYSVAWYRTGNPVYPFLNHVFKSPDFDTHQEFIDDRHRKPLRVTTLYDMTFRSNDYYEAQKGGMGFQYFLLLIPSALLLRRRPQIMLLVIAVCAAITSYLSQSNMRYLYPALATLSIILAEFPLAWGLAPLIALNLFFMPASGWNHREFALPTRAAVDAYVTRGHPHQKLIAYLNEKAPGEPAAFFGGDPIAGFHGRAYTDTWHTYAYAIRLGTFETAAQVRAEWQHLGVHYVVAPTSGETIYPAAKEILRPLLATPLIVSGEFALFKLPEPTLPEVSKTVPVPLNAPKPNVPKPDAPKRVAAQTAAAQPAASERPASIAPTPVPLRATEYDDFDKAIEYTGGWIQSTIFPETLHATLTFSDHTDDSLRFTFQGRGIEYWYTRAYNRGMARIAVDGAERARLDLYSAEILWRQSTRFENLGPGMHTIEIRVLPEKNPAASGQYVDLDQFTVLP